MGKSKVGSTVKVRGSVETPLGKRTPDYKNQEGILKGERRKMPENRIQYKVLLDSGFTVYADKVKRVKNP